MGYTNNGLLEHAIRCCKLGNNSIYILGEFGRKVTQTTINQKCSQNYVKDFNLPRKDKYLQAMGKYKPLYAFDCVGLIKAYYWGFPNVKYDANTDVNEAMMLSRAKVKGKIDTIPSVAGTLVVMNGHIGIYDGKGYVYECTPNTTFAKQSHGMGGVCKTKLTDRKWTDWCYCPYISYITESTPQNKPNTSVSTNKKIKVGAKCKVSQKALKYATGQTIPAWVKRATHTIQEVKGEKVLLKEIYSWVYKIDIEVL